MLRCGGYLVKEKKKRDGNNDGSTKSKDLRRRKKKKKLRTSAEHKGSIVSEDVTSPANRNTHRRSRGSAPLGVGHLSTFRRLHGHPRRQDDTTILLSLDQKETAGVTLHEERVDRRYRGAVADSGLLGNTTLQVGDCFRMSARSRDRHHYRRTFKYGTLRVDDGDEISGNNVGGSSDSNGGKASRGYSRRGSSMPIISKALMTLLPDMGFMSPLYSFNNPTPFGNYVSGANGNETENDASEILNEMEDDIDREETEVASTAQGIDEDAGGGDDEEEEEGGAREFDEGGGEYEGEGRAI